MPNLIVPKLKNLDEHYRISFDQNQQSFNKQVEQEIQKPGMTEIFGRSSSDESPREEAKEEPPKKKAKVGFSFT